MKGMKKGEAKDKKAVALEYQHGIDFAPRLRAQGSGKMAEQIIAIAQREGIPIHEDKDLIEVISNLDLNEFIPPALYRAVAEVLVFVHKTGGKM